MSTDQNQSKPSRGTSLHLGNRFHKTNPVANPEMNQLPAEDREIAPSKTQTIEVKAKSMINKVNSPDLLMEYSLNPYQGCEHGCVYCYARPTHNYWGYSAADDFENKILVKANAVEVLSRELKSRKYQVKPIMLSGNTDCYQPVEKKYRLTRQILELMLAWRHPVTIITKNALIQRDLDLLGELNDLHLVQVAISVTAAHDRTRRVMEPRASTIASRFRTIRLLAERGIPVHGMLAPIIPGVNDMEIFDMVKQVAEAGAKTASYQIVRLNGDLQPIFGHWLEEQFPDRKERILNSIRSSHGGELGDSRFGTRMKGEGNIADIIRQQFKLAHSSFMPKTERQSLRTDLFRPVRGNMRELWELS